MALYRTHRYSAIIFYEQQRWNSHRSIAYKFCTLLWNIEAWRRPFLHSSGIWHIPNLAPRIAPATAAFISASPPDKTIFRDAQHHVGIISPVASLPSTTMIILHDLWIVLYSIRIKTIHLLLGHKLRAQPQRSAFTKTFRNFALACWIREKVLGRFILKLS